MALDADVIIVGAGISGLSAALDLGRGGANVVVVDMSSVFGGHAVMSQGAVSIVATPEQARAGIKDSPDLAFADFHRWGEVPNTAWVRYYVDHSRRDIYDWLDELGVRYMDVWASYGNSVFIVEPKLDPSGQPMLGPEGQKLTIARQQFVKLGPTRGDYVAILDGVKPGQEVISAGAFKLRNGAPVQVKNEVVLKHELQPSPENR